jgi:hypothetical protein
MTYQRTLELSAAQRQTLQYHRDHDHRAFVRERSAAILKIADGHSPHWVALHGLLKERDPDTVYAWLNHYATMGLEGLIVHQHGGNRRGCF